jgi:hypothetical protein
MKAFMPLWTSIEEFFEKSGNQISKIIILSSLAEFFVFMFFAFHFRLTLLLQRMDLISMILVIALSIHNFYWCCYVRFHLHPGHCRTGHCRY